MRHQRVIVVLPTYNEAENVASLVDALYGLAVRGLEVLVVDDESPDGTSDIVERLIAEGRYPGLRLLTRAGPPGRGWAGREGFMEAILLGADFIVEMDADFSHQPRHVPELLAAMKDCDVAVGSRFVGGGADQDRGLLRRLITRLANAFARRLLGLPVIDCNSGFRCYSRRALERIEPETLKSRGPSIVHEVLVRALDAGLAVKEVPIEFVDRRKGDSKLSLARLAAGYWWVLRARFSKRL
ncbi:MAG: polyprenol monophosphomannose synthase [Elusimicrobia bacterium]|nr:polyprenol monophosphomannose synthase [Elusimicrobiota bacterium]